MKRVALFLMLFVSSNCWGEEQLPPPKAAITKSLVPNTVAAKPGDLIEIASSAKGKCAWLYDVRDFPVGRARIFNSENVLILTTPKPGTYSVYMIAWDEQQVLQILVVVAGKVPDPVDPDDPPIPIPTTIRVLIVYEKDQGSPALGESLREYLNSKCKMEEGWPAWRTADKDWKFVGPKMEAWKKALADAKKEPLPRLVVFDADKGTKIMDEPLPPTDAARIDKINSLFKTKHHK